jgi:hypothetical protein
MTVGQYRAGVSAPRYRNSSVVAWDTLRLTALAFSCGVPPEPSAATPR